MHFKNGFKDKNSERFMISTRIKKLCSTLRNKYYCYDSFVPGTFRMKEGLYRYDELKELDFEMFDGKEQRWGGENQNAWFIQQFSIPESMEGKAVYYSTNLTDNGGWYWGAPQVLVYVNGKPVSGMDVNHREILLTSNAKKDELFEVALCAFTDRFFYNGKVEMNMAVIAVNPHVNKLYYDIKVPFEIAEMLENDDIRRLDILNYLNNAISKVDFRLPPGDDFDESVKDALDYLRVEFYEKYCGHDDYTVTCVAHTHIDIAWLWTLAQTKEKTARSFSTVMSLIDEFDDFRFIASQPQLYEFLKLNYPDIYQKIKGYVDAKRWEPEGAMWVEADTNIASGESLVRQILYGKAFFKQEFGIENKVLWLPDVFGYSAALPQILKKSGIDYFVTTKISWNKFNKFPYDTFMWRGIDGSEVLSHFICTQDYNLPETEYLTTYNGYLDPAYVMGAWRRYQQKDLNRDILFSFGFGDGGGGPSREMIENANRMQKGIPGCPKVKFDTVLNYFEKLDKEVSDSKRLPKWSGELYFEYHSGTYTSTGKIKKNNRKSEILLHDVELFSSIDMIVNGIGYPKHTIDKSWKLLLLNQFHDILPGCSIKEVYEDSDKQFSQVFTDCHDMLDDALCNIASTVELADTSIIVFNSTSFIRSDVVEISLPYDNFEIVDNGTVLPWQKSDKGNIIFFASGIPSKGYKSYTIRSVGKTANNVENCIKDCKNLSNQYFDLSLDQFGNISSLYDKKNERELATEDQPLNRIIAFEDTPLNDDAWNIGPYYQEKSWFIDDISEVRIIENGPVRQVIRIVKTFMSSSIEQDLIMYNDIPRIDIKNKIDWKESNILLKADFPTKLNAVKAAYDIQFGNLERTTTSNTSWDFAQYEVSAHRWADLSQENYGISILNDCKYGYDIKDGHIRLTLLKSSTYPNPDADKEIHEFTYSIYPHAGTWKDSDTVKMAAFLNCPTYAKLEDAHSGKLPPSYSFASSDSDNVLIETIKRAENTDELIIRLYEYKNMNSTVKLSLQKPIKSAYECDLLERNENKANFVGKEIYLDAKPYEIKTIKLEL